MSINLIQEEKLINKALESLVSGEFNFLKQNIKSITDILSNEVLYSQLNLTFENYKLDSLLAFCYFHLKEANISYNIIQNTLIILDNINDTITREIYRNVLLNIMIKLYLLNNNFDDFKYVINYLSQYYLESNNISNISLLYKDILNSLVNNYTFQKEFINLFLTYIISHINEFSFDLNSLRIIYNSVGSCYSDIFSNTRKAIEYYAKALNISILNNDTQGEILTRNALGVEYILLGDYDKALEIFNILLNDKKYSQCIDFRLRCILHLNLIESNLRIKNTNTIENLLNTLKTTLEKVDNIFDRNMIYENYIVLRAEYLNTINKPNESLELLDYYTNNLKNSPHEITISNDVKYNILLNFGYANLLKKNYDIAIKYFIESYGLQENINLTLTRLDSLEFLYKTYKEIGDFENACACLEDIVSNLKEKNKQTFKNNLEYIYEKFELQEKNNKIKELQQMNYLDGLTNISNRKFIDSNLPIEINKTSIIEPLSILMLDIDYFKYFNDTYGHIKGDEILIFVSTELNSLCKKNNYSVSRYGGEEFLIICPKTDESEVESFANQIKTRFEQLKIEHKSSSTSPFLSLSMGGATIYQKTSKNDLISYADMALYYSKANGRNRFTHSTNINIDEM